MSKEIYHAHKRFNQKKTPICGIYAFLNGISKTHKCRKNMKCVVNKLWDLAIDVDIKANQEIITFDANKESVLGEFFSSTKLATFLDGKKDEIKEILKDFENISDYEVKTVYRNKLSKEFKHYIDAKGENYFYLIPINSSWECENENNLHWICLKKHKEKYYIYNSASDTTSERHAMYNSYGKEKKITKFCQLEKLWSDMISRDKDQCFDLTRWVKCRNLKFFRKYSINFKNNYIALKDSKIHYKSLFINSDFDIVQVKVEY